MLLRLTCLIASLLTRPGAHWRVPLLAGLLGAVLDLAWMLGWPLHVRAGTDVEGLLLVTALSFLLHGGIARFGVAMWRRYWRPALTRGPGAAGTHVAPTLAAQQRQIVAGLPFLLFLAVVTVALHTRTHWLDDQAVHAWAPAFRLASYAWYYLLAAIAMLPWLVASRTTPSTPIPGEGPPTTR